MPFITLTKEGYKELRTAALANQKIKVTKFKLTDYIGEDAETSEDIILRGTVTYENNVFSCFAKDNDIVVWTAIIDENFNDSFQEIGLYLENGTLFAIGTLEEPHLKDNSHSLRVYCLAKVTDLSFFIETNYERMTALPKKINYKDVPLPMMTEKDGFIVLNGHGMGEYSPSLVVKSFRRDVKDRFPEWLSVNGSLLYQGKLKNITSNTFELGEEIENSDFSFDLGFIYIKDSDGIGQTRHIGYDSIDKDFLLIDEPFSVLPNDENSIVTIWSSVGNCGGGHDSNCIIYGYDYNDIEPDPENKEIDLPLPLCDPNDNEPILGKKIIQRMNTTNLKIKDPIQFESYRGSKIFEGQKNTPEVEEKENSYEVKAKNKTERLKLNTKSGNKSLELVISEEESKMLTNINENDYSFEAPPSEFEKDGKTIFVAYKDERKKSKYRVEKFKNTLFPNKKFDIDTARKLSSNLIYNTPLERISYYKKSKDESGIMAIYKINYVWNSEKGVFDYSTKEKRD